MQQLRFLFQLSATVLVCLSAALFAAAEGNPLAAVTLPLAVLTFLLIDRPDRAGMSAGWALALGLLGAAAALWEFVSGNVESRLLAPAHLVTYSTWVFLLQRKQARQYWLLFGLSVLLVAVSSLLTSADWLGLSLLAYACAGLWTLGVFSVYRATLPLEANLRRPHGGDDSPAAPAGPRRMRGGGVLRGERSFVRHAVQLDPHEHWVGARFVGGAAATIVLSLWLSVLFFVLIPRVWLGQFRLFDDRPLPGGRTLTGFTDEVALGDMGQILESDDLVMEIELFDHDTGTPVPPHEYLTELNGGEPLFRGAVLEQYVSGRWLAGRGASPSQDPRLRAESGALRQQIRLQPIGSPTLFGVGTVLACIPIDPDDAVFYNPNTNFYQRPVNADLSRVAEYRAVSSRTGQGLTRRGGNWKQFDHRRLARVAAQAHALTADRDGWTLSDHDRATLLEGWLRDSGEFQYSLNLAIGDATVDPLEDFLFNRKQGHCEYFASALAIMLRSVDVPARVVSGFKGGVYNRRTGRFEVRQLHAHAWVEAHVDGRWLPLDPTPPARDASVAEMQERRSYIWSRWNQTWKETWNRGVTLSRNDQERLFYGPLRSTASEAWSALRDVRGSAAGLAAFLRHLALSPESWISWRGGLAAFVLLILLAGGARLLRWGWSLLRRVGEVVGDARRAARAVAFYERFRRLIAREGLQRHATQTQQEFAREVGRRLGARLAPAGLESFPEELVADFYCVRFGQQPLAESDLEGLDTRLAALERALSQETGAGHERPRR